VKEDLSADRWSCRHGQNNASGGGSAGTGVEGAAFPTAGSCGVLPSRPPSTQAEPPQETSVLRHLEKTI
jgi:hypothetical protein